MKKNDESYLQIAVVNLLKKLQLSGIDFIFFHVPNGGSRNAAEASKLKMMGVTAGVPDIVIIKDGRMFFIELKTASGSLSKTQDDFIKQLSKHSVKTHILQANDVESVLCGLRKILHEEMGADQNKLTELSSSVISSLARLG